jgi:glycosyltransferase involved in cell wall biosynthesis
MTAPGPARLRVWLACDWFVKYTVGLADGLLDAGCEVTLLTRDHDQEFGGEPAAMRSFLADRLGGRAHHLELGSRVSDPRAVQRLAAISRRRRAWRPDVVHVQDSLANDPRLALASGLLTRPYALTVHDPIPHPGDAPARRVSTAIRAALRRRAGLVFVHSEELGRELAATGGINAPIEVVPHGVGAATATPLPETPNLLFFGRMSHYKGLDVLLDAMPSLWERHPELRLTVAGEGEAIDHPVIGDKRLTCHFEHIPEEDVGGLFDAASFVVLPYRQASQSGVGSLARQYGRAVIATAVGGLPELVGPDWGEIVPPEDPAALTAAILRLLDTPGLAAAMGEAAARSLGDASWPAVGRATVAAYRRHLL